MEEKEKKINSEQHPHQDIVVVPGDGNIDISKVYSHINIENSKDNKPENHVIIPTEKKKE